MISEMTVRLSECIPGVFHDLHRDILHREHREYWLRGGRGSGKSSFVSLEILLGMARDENARDRKSTRLNSSH